MTSSTESKQSLKNGSPCAHSDCALPASSLSGCPADLAIRCVNGILKEISSLTSIEEQLERFSDIVELHLQTAYKDDVQCFWSLREKPDEGQYRQFKREPRCRILNQAIFNLNSKFHSVEFLENLIRLKIGSGHIFGIGYDNSSLIFRPYSVNCLNDKDAETVNPNKSNRSYDWDSHNLLVRSAWPSGQSLGSLVDWAVARCHDGDDHEKTLAAIETKAESFFREWTNPERSDEIEFFCEKLRNLAPRDFGQESPYEFPSLETTKRALAHFSLIALYAENNRFCQASYILAPLSGGDTHSSLVVFWPFPFNSGRVGPHIEFLLHVMLGLNAIRAKTTISMTELLDTILLHGMRTLRLNLNTPVNTMIRELNQIQENDVIKIEQRDKWVKRLDHLRSLVNLSFISTGINADGMINDLEPLSSLYQKMQNATNLTDLSVKFIGCWDSPLMVPKALRVVLANLITNAYAETVNRHTDVVLSAFEVPNGLKFLVKSKKPMSSEWRKKSFDNPYSDRPPTKHRGLWICRTIVRRCGDGSTWKLEPEEEEFKTVISFVVIVPEGCRRL